MISLRDVMHALWGIFGIAAIVFSVMAAFRGEWGVATYALVLGLHFDRQASLLER